MEAHRVWTVITPLAVLLALTLALARDGGPLPGDERVARALADAPDGIAEAVSRVTSLGVWSAVVLAGAGALALGGRRRDALLLLGAVVSAELVSLALKEMADRPRPPAATMEGLAATGSFPSSSVVRVGVALGVLALLWAGARPGRHLLVAVGYALVLALVGAARVAAGEHWPSDVLGAVLLLAVWLPLVAATWGRLAFAAHGDRRPGATAASPR